MKLRMLWIGLVVMLGLYFVAPNVRAQSIVFPVIGVVNSSANLRGAPGTGSPVVGQAQEGQTLTLVGCNDGCTWYNTDDGAWIAAFLIDVAPQAAPTAPAPAVPVDTITVSSWNVESGGALQTVVSQRIGAFDGVDIWGLSEVAAVDAEEFEIAAEEGEGANFDSYLGTTGGNDRLLLIWDGARFEQVNQGQMTEIGETGRAPLWVQLRERATGLELIVMVNHLHRSNEGIRHRQAQALNAWAAAQTLPVVALGDYNFDWNLPDGTSHDQGFDYLLANGHWQWVKPVEIVTTQCSGWPCQYNSILDFVFVAGPARTWNNTAEIVVVDADFPDDVTTPDHRPLLAVLSPSGTAAAPAATSAPILLPTATPMPTVAAPQCPQAQRQANVRGGPGTGYPIITSLEPGVCIVVTGRNQGGDWFQMSTGGWVASFLLINMAPVDAIPVVYVEPTPVPTTAVPPTAVAPQQSVAPAPTPVPPTPVPAQPPAQSCDPNYSGACIPVVGGDLDCGDVPFKRFHSVGSDPHGFDRDGDGIACE
jgi:uncharacterized protein YraI